MPQLHTISLHFPQGLHVGTRGVNLEETGVQIPSDTIFSALVDIWGRTGGDPDAWMKPFLQRDPPFLLTSAFPFAGKVRFYPIPVDLKCFIHQYDAKELKSIKSIRFLSAGLLRKALAGQSLQADLDALQEQTDYQENVQSAAALQGGALWLDKQEVNQLPDALRLNTKGGKRPVPLLKHQNVWTESRTPRVTVDRIHSGGNIFHVGRTHFAPHCGLWFGIQWRHPDALVEDTISYKEALHKSLAVLGDEGIGGERSAGYGAFYPTYGEEIHLPHPQAGRVAWLLSRYLPTQAEIPMVRAHDAAYQLVRVGGWARSLDRADQRRKQITFLTAGSLIQWDPSDSSTAAVVGSIEDLRPTYTAGAGNLPHPVYRNGLALAVGLADS